MTASDFITLVEQYGDEGVTIKIRQTEHANERAKERGILNKVQGIERIKVTPQTVLGAFDSNETDKLGDVVIKVRIDTPESDVNREVIVGVIALVDFSENRSFVGNLVTVFAMDPIDYKLKTWKEARWKEKSI